MLRAEKKLGDNKKSDRDTGLDRFAVVVLRIELRLQD